MLCILTTDLEAFVLAEYMNICLALSMERAIGSNKTISTFKIVFSSAMLDNLTSALLETPLLTDYLSMVICFKEAICDEKVCHIYTILLLDPRTFKRPQILFFFPLDHTYYGNGMLSVHLLMVD